MHLSVCQTIIILTCFCTIWAGAGPLLANVFIACRLGVCREVILWQVFSTMPVRIALVGALVGLSYLPGHKLLESTG